MCTTAAKQLNNDWFLLKTRDPVPWMRWDDEIKLFDTPEDKFKKLIIQNPNPHEDGYYGGINEKGVAFVSTFVPVAENQISYIHRPYVRLILDASTAKEAVEIIKSFNPRIGGNMFVVDKDECYGIEGVPREYYIEKISSPAVKTNHFIHLSDKNLSFATEQLLEKWSNDHYNRAMKLISTASSVEDFQCLLRDCANAESKTAICSTSEEDECFTHSAFIFDTRNCRACYCQGNPLENDFKEYHF
ncbi:hypothetical protein GYA13_01010 [Candidatus Kuenenbacteria bacterium]|nr:hypothetical protein [Candidatus Kuenenbacteria bacterium]